MYSWTGPSKLAKTAEQPGQVLGLIVGAQEVEVARGPIRHRRIAREGAGHAAGTLSHGSTTGGSSQFGGQGRQTADALETRDMTDPSGRWPARGASTRLVRIARPRAPSESGCRESGAAESVAIANAVDPI